MLLVLLAGCLTDLSAQSRSKKKKKKKKKEDTEERAPLKDHLWYGGTGQLGFNSFNGGSVFSIGVAPMVGYKIIEQVSIGPKFSVLFNSFKAQGYKSAGLFDLEAGGFVRARVFRGFFLQGELSNEWQQFPIFGIPPKIDKFTQERVNQRAGVGYNWGTGEGGWSSEIGVMYNFAVGNDPNSFQNPFELRFGFTYNFY